MSTGTDRARISVSPDRVARTPSDDLLSHLLRPGEVGNRLADQSLERYGGDVDECERLLRELPGIGPAGADIFLREGQSVWPEAAPYFGSKALQGAARLGLPTSPSTIARLVEENEHPAHASGLVRSALDKRVMDNVTARADS
ncbi:hypothetical protein [Streptomyces sp. NPDC091217]|uniref:hypothetical protein n=1 Tax=Streptomyces sp. NPDC091217 TaxID=3365975 RepID=UPI00380CB6E8